MPRVRCVAPIDPMLAFSSSCSLRLLGSRVEYKFSNLTNFHRDNFYDFSDMFIQAADRIEEQKWDIFDLYACSSRAVSVLLIN